MTEKEAIKLKIDDMIQVMKRAYENFKKTPKPRRTIAYAKVRVEYLEDHWNKYREYFNNQPLTEQRASVQLYSDVEELYLTYKTELQVVIENTSATTVSLADGTIYNKGGVSLPRIDLPKFSGGHEDWQHFEDTFVSLIDNNANLTDVQRLHYLKSCLAGEAASAIKSYQITENNYKPAWESLKKRYSHKRLIVNAILKRIFNVKKVNAQSTTQLKNLIDTTLECLTGLKNCDVSINSWDPMVIFVVTQKLDQDTHREWEHHVSRTIGVELPSLKEFIAFLESHIQTLELTTSTTSSHKGLRERVLHTVVSSQISKHKDKICEYCKDKHSLYNCKSFCKLAQPDRSEFIKGNNLCFNCFLPGHSVRACRLKSFCKLCSRRHHTLLHSSYSKGTSEPTQTAQPIQDVSLHTHIDGKVAGEMSPSEASIQAAIATFFTCIDSPGLLATALVPVKDKLGNTTVLRAIVDPGAQVTLISERAAQMLHSDKTPIRGHISGTGSMRSAVTHVTSFEIFSNTDPTFNLEVISYVTAGKITTFFPKKCLDSRGWHHVTGLKLADPNFTQPGRIDLLLSSKVYGKILKSGVIHGAPDQPTAQNTRLGWIIFGDIGEHSELSHKEALSLHLHTDLDNMLKGMWELEPTERRKLTAEEKLCEEIYQKTHSRNSEGRYVVKLPFKTQTPISVQGETRGIALKRLQQLERKFQRQPELKGEYTKVIKEYLDMNHMELVPDNEKENPAVYLPHHAVVREDKDTSKTRVVFDASNKGTNNVSLNEELLVGPQLQDDLRNLIMKWRMKRICFIADIQRMYREILVTKEDADYQRILWRYNDDGEVLDFRLLRVTFGTASAPYLAVRTLHQLADDEGRNHPAAAKTIKEDFFMDDMMSGHDTVEEALEVAQAVKNILQRGGFTLHKWASNNSTFLQHFQPDERSTHVTHVNLDLKGMVKALGIAWDVGRDVFRYLLVQPPFPGVLTKRVILSELQRLFDPLGWLAPAILPARIVMQKLWLKGIGWDTEVDGQLREEWLRIRLGFENLNEIEVHRWLWTTTERIKNTTIHGFSDASTKAYAAVAYMRVETEDGNIRTEIIAGKGRVAPVKTVSLPRLELLGALVLSRLLKQIREVTGVSNDKIYAWTDSTVVLSWLNGDPGRWNVFVSNRVVEILENIGSSRFHHVVSEENPADVATRGLSPSALAQDQQWWCGPSWLRTNNIPFTRGNIEVTELEMRKCFHTTVCITEEEKRIDLNEFDTLLELQRVIAYARRFLNFKRTEDKEPKEITTKELEEALEILIKRVQLEEFHEEIFRLQQGKTVKKTSRLKNLNPFLDSRNILRVGGRLRNANIPEMEKHPIIIGHKNDLLTLLIKDAHRRTLHGGVQLTLAYLRCMYWIIKLKGSVRKYIHKCLVCARHKAKISEQIMGDLPEARVTPARPFKNAAVDFAGPFDILMSRYRGAKCSKAYLAIFVCMVTRSTHLELVGSLDCEGFVNAFKRFVARRGRCAHMWSDNGTNLTAGNKELAKLWKEAQLDLPAQLQHLLAEDGTQWHHIPPYSPNFGGLWESGVASVKYHLKRILNTNLTFEEFSTVLCQIEACLNSRPLCPIDCDDPAIVEVLTPGHFLIGESLINVPSPDLSNVSVSRLSRWQHCQRVVQHFWRRWQEEYLTRLQNRLKWQRQRPEYIIGDIVLVKEDNLPPGKWSMGRIVQKHPGKDGVCRVYSLKYHGKITQRSVSKLCQLPLNDD